MSGLGCSLFCRSSVTFGRNRFDIGRDLFGWSRFDVGWSRFDVGWSQFDVGWNRFLTSIFDLRLYILQSVTSKYQHPIKRVEMLSTFALNVDSRKSVKFSLESYKTKYVSLSSTYYLLA